MEKKLYSIRGGLGEARKRKGLTQKQLAKEMGVILKTVRNWEQGIANPDFETLMKLSILLECDLDCLTGKLVESTHDIHYVHEFTGLSEKAVRKMAPPGLHPNASSPTVAALNQLIEADGFQDFIQAFHGFMSTVYRLKTWVKPEMPPYPVDKDGNTIIDETWHPPEGACVVIGKNTVTLPIDEAVGYFVQEVARAVSRLCEGYCKESQEMPMKNSKKKRSDSHKDRRQE